MTNPASAQPRQNTPGVKGNGEWTVGLQGEPAPEHPFAGSARSRAELIELPELTAAKAKLAAVAVAAGEATREVAEASVTALHALLDQRFPGWVSAEFARDYDSGDSFSELRAVRGDSDSAETLWHFDEAGADDQQLDANDLAWNLGTEIGSFMDETIHEDDTETSVLYQGWPAEDAATSAEEMAFERRILDEGR